MGRHVVGNESCIARSIETLRETLCEVDRLGVAAEAALHLQWAIDLLDEAHKLGQLNRLEG
jgi:hypothetical protein